MAAILAETYPEVYAAAGIHSGLPHGSANDVMSAFAAMRGQPGIEAPPSGGRINGGIRPRVIVFHGDADTTVHPGNAARIIAGHGGETAGRVSRPTHPSSGTTRGYTRMATERGELECWIVEGAGHAWSGGSPSGSYTDPRGPDASAEMVRFFLHGASDAKIA